MRLLSPSVRELRLSTPGQRVLFLVAAGIIAMLPAFEAARIATAVTLSGSADPATLQRALAIDPGNDEIEHRLGMALFYSDGSADRVSGLDHLRRATELNPREALYWSDLAAACEASRHESCASAAVARALAASPKTPRLYWSAANYDLRAGRESDALANFRHLLELDPAYAASVFQTCLRVFGTPSSGVKQGILATNRNPHVSMAFINLASGVGDAADAYAEWRRLSADYAGDADGHEKDAAEGNEAQSERSAPLTVAEVEPYLDRLISSGREHDAISVWTGLQRLSMISSSELRLRSEAESSAPSGSAAASRFRNELVFNGGFERVPLNAGFDWRLNPEPFVSIALSKESHAGSYAVRIELSGDRNQEYEPMFEIVPVRPGRSYVLSAFVRSQAITSDTGPRLRVRDLTCSSSPCLDVSTPDIESTTPWHAIRAAFTASPETRFVRLAIWRPKSRGYPSEISGVLWVDDVSIVEQPLSCQ
jgi:tetratricopeptide (TPR) repeat protein